MGAESETWICPKCGFEVESAAEACWNCGESKEAWRSLDANQRVWLRDRDPESFTPDKPGIEEKPWKPIIPDPKDRSELALAKILANQNAHSKRLKNIESKVGCLFAWLVFTLVVSALGFLLSLLGAF